MLLQTRNRIMKTGIVIIDEKGRRLQELDRNSVTSTINFVVLDDNGNPVLGKNGLEEVVTLSKTKVVELLSGAPHSDCQAYEKRVIDRYCDILVFGQVFVDELEHLCGYRNTLFRFGLKQNAMKVIKEFRGVVDKLFTNTNNKVGLMKLYDVNYELMRKVNSLTIDEKAQLVEVFDSVVKGLRTSYREVTESIEAAGV